MTRAFPAPPSPGRTSPFDSLSLAHPSTGRGDPEPVEGSGQAAPPALRRPVGRREDTRRSSATGRDIRIVRHEHQRHAASAAHLQQQVEHVPAVRAVQVAGRFVGQNQRRIVGERPRDGDALLLASGQLRRVMVAAIVQSHLVEQAPARARPRRAGRRSPSAPGCFQSRSATARGGRTGRRIRSSRRAAWRARLHRAW